MQVLLKAALTTRIPQADGSTFSLKVGVMI